MPKQTKQTFEKAMKELEQIVLELESGELPLEKAMKKFEDGMKLSKFCTEKLDQTEKKITTLMQDSEGEIVEKRLPTEQESDDV